MNITEDQLKAIEAALNFTGDPLAGIIACRAIRANVASNHLLKLARDEFRTQHDVGIDDDAGTSDYDGGCWVQAWVHMQKPSVDCTACSGTGTTGGSEIQDFCESCGGEGQTYVEFEDAA